MFRFGNCLVDPARREPKRDGRPVKIEPRALDVLFYLIEHRDRVVGKEELRNAIWGTIVTDGALTRSIMKLRKALADDSTSIIKTVPRFGYCFVADIHSPGAAPVPDAKPYRAELQAADGPCPAGAKVDIALERNVSVSGKRFRVTARVIDPRRKSERGS